MEGKKTPEEVSCFYFNSDFPKETINLWFLNQIMCVLKKWSIFDE